MDKQYIDLGATNGASVNMTFSETDPVSPWADLHGKQEDPHGAGIFYIQVRDPKNQKILYERKVENKNQLSFNLPTASGKVCVIVIGEPKIKQHLVTPLKKPTIPFDRVPEVENPRPYKFTDFKAVANPSLAGYARMYTNKPIIEFNPGLMNTVSEPTQAFLMRHETGHYYFDDEILTDRWAINRFLNDGYNMSSANYGLSHVLSLSPYNLERMQAGDTYLKELNKTYYNEPIEA